MLDTSQRRWSVAIFSAREDIGTLSSAIDAVFTAVGHRNATVDVIVNGNPELAADLGTRFQLPRYPAPGSYCTTRLWSVALRDKSNAWNQYVHTIWPDSETTFFVDGYVCVMPDALELLEQGMCSAPGALAGAAVPSQGRSASRLRALTIREPQLQGALYALSGQTLEELRRRGLRLPLGLYRGDGLLGSLLNFHLDPTRNAWDPQRIVVVEAATWTRQAQSALRLAHLRSHGTRLLRQALGRFEGQALKQHLAVERRPAEALPATSRALVSCWTRRHPLAAAKLFLRSPLVLIPFCQLTLRTDLLQEVLPPTLVAEVAPASHRPAREHVET